MPTTNLFLPTLYWMVFLGISGFSLAAESSVLWLGASAAIGLNGWLVLTGRFKPMPRAAANAVSLGLTILAGWYVITAARAEGIAPIITIGQFLVLLQLVKLYEQRANRDYAQLLLLSLLLMIAAAISTASLLFGVILIIYLLVALYCCMLFHLKVEAEAAQKQAEFVPAGKAPEPAIALAMGDRRQATLLAISLRRILYFVSAVATAVAVVVFLLFPRQAAEGVLGRRVLSGDQVLSGFNENVSFDTVSRISRNEQVVAEVQVTSNGQAWNGGDLLLRGNTLDAYSGDGRAFQIAGLTGGFRSNKMMWQWINTGDQDNVGVQDLAGGVPKTLYEDSGGYLQDITLEPTGSKVIFSMAGAYKIQSSRDMAIYRSHRDSLINIEGGMPAQGPQHYLIWATGKAPDYHSSSVGENSQVSPRVAAYALQPDVSGTDSTGRSLAVLRGNVKAVNPLDHAIASAIERHLRNQFSYTLDLTDDKDLLKDGTDPIVHFLYDVKKGHCEYFASAMTLLCQSLGMTSRMVIGFRSDEYNPVGGFYTVRESHAHAWVEVLTDNGWETFDPTSSNDAPESADAGMFSAIKNVYGYLEFKWGASVVAYGQSNQQEAVTAFDSAITRTAIRGSNQLLMMRRWTDAAQNAILSTVSVAILAILGLMAAGYFAYRKWAIRSLARRIGLNDLPGSEQERLARQLGFYDDLLRLLKEHDIYRRADLTPLEFCDRLSFLPLNIYDDIRRLTLMFYKVRFGQANLNGVRQRRLSNVIANIAAGLKQIA